MYKIGEFSQLGQVSPRMLRHYDKLGLLVPSHNDKWTGYRYYTIDQLSKLHRIIALKDLGLSLAQIGELLESDDGMPTEQLRGMLRLKQNELMRDIEAGMWRLQSVQARLQELEQEESPSPYEIAVKSVAAQPVASIRMVVPHVAEMGYYCELLYGQLYGGLKKAKIKALQPEVTFYHTGEYRETDVDVEIASGVHPNYAAHENLDDRIFFREAPGHELVASLIYEGALAHMNAAILALLGWIGRHDHIIAGPLRELHLSGPVHDDDVVDEELVTEIQIPIVRRPALPE